MNVIELKEPNYNKGDGKMTVKELKELLVNVDDELEIVASVILFVHIVYRYSAFAFPCGNHCLVNVMSVHSFATVGRQQGRVNVYYLVWKGCKQVLGN